MQPSFDSDTFVMFLLWIGVGFVMADAVCNDLTLFIKRHRIDAARIHSKLSKRTSLKCAEYCSATRQCRSFHFEDSLKSCFIHKRLHKKSSTKSQIRYSVNTEYWGKLKEKLVLCKDPCFSNTGCVESHSIIVCFTAKTSCEKPPLIPHSKCRMLSGQSSVSEWRCYCKKGYRYINKKWPKSTTVEKCNGSWKRIFISCQRNIAYRKSTRQSSRSMGRPPSQAVDGNTVMDLIKGTCSSTNLESAPWWQVDLGAIYNINVIVIYNRVDCCWNRLDRLRILVANRTRSGTQFKTCFKQRRTTSKGMSAVWCNKHSTGQVVRIAIRNGSPLTLCEIEIFEKLGNI